MDGADGTGGGSETIATAASTHGVDDTMSPTTSATPVCGDAVLDPGEDCDDGNDIDADGCSHACEVSGTRAWSLELDDGMPSIGVALETHDGDAVVLVQHYRGSFESSGATVTRVDGAGSVVAEFYDSAAFADPDLTRQPLAVASDGDVLLGYPSIDVDGLSLARVDLATGIEWSQTLGDFAQGILWIPDHVVMLSSGIDQESYFLLEVPEDGGTPSMIEVPIAIGEVPLRDRRMFRRLELSIVTTAPDGAVTLYAGYPLVAPTTWSITVIGAPSPGPTAAASNDTDLWVWTANERILIDVLGHPAMEPVPRTTESVLMALAADGAITREDQDVLFMTIDEQERWRGTTQGIPRFAAPDGEGGVYVLVTVAEAPGNVWLERWVL